MDDDFGDEHDPPMTLADAMLVAVAVAASWLAVLAVVALLMH